jgi:ABC-type nickel/cobalt efflux system permease component RcnA
VGATLVALGVYVFYSLIRHGRDFRMRSRWMLVFAAFRRLVRLVKRGPRRAVEIEIVHDHAHETDALHEHSHDRAFVGGSGRVLTATRTHQHVHRHRASMPEDPFAEYGTWTALGVGMIHGVGAETPTQLLVFFAALGVGGALGGILLLVAFVVGLLIANTLIALAATYGFLRAGRSWPAYATVAVITGIFSFALGVTFLLGKGTVLPALFAG